MNCIACGKPTEEVGLIAGSVVGDTVVYFLICEFCGTLLCEDHDESNVFGESHERSVRGLFR